MRAAFAQRNQSKGGHAGKDFRPGKDPLEAEHSIDKLVPQGQDEQAQVMKLLDKMIDASTSANERNALQMWKANLRADEAQSTVQLQFVHDFQRWLIGRGREEDHKNTPWGRQSLADDPEVSAYLDAFLEKEQEFRLKLEILKIRRPVGINQVYLYYKYIVRGEPLNKQNFLRDWEYLFSEFSKARASGQAYRDPERSLPHEVAPYGDLRAKFAEESMQKRDEHLPGSVKAVELTDDEIDMEHNSTDSEVVDLPPNQSEQTAALTRVIDRLAEKLSGLDSPEKKAGAARETEQEAIRLKAESDLKIQKLQNELDTLNAAKLPSESQLALVDEAKKQSTLLEQIVADSRATQERHTQEIRAISEQRNREFAELRNLLQMPQPPQIAAPSETNDESKMLMIQHFAKFQQGFERFMIGNEARLQQIEGNLQSNSGDTKLLIQELDSMSKTWKSLGEELKAIPEKIEQIEWKSATDADATKAEILALVAASDKTSDVVAAIDRQRDEDGRRWNEFFAKLNQTFAGIRQQIASNDVSGAIREQTKLIGEIIERTPAANKEMLLEWKRELENNLALQIESHEATRNIPSEQLSEAIRALQKHSDDQHRLFQHFAHLQQIQEQQAKQLLLAEKAFVDLKGKAGSEIVSLQQQSNYARQHAAQTENVMRRMMQGMNDLRQQNQYLASLNQQQAQAFYRQQQQAQQEFHRQSTFLRQQVEELTRNIPRLGAAEDMDVSDDEAETNLSPGEQWLLGNGGEAPPLLLEGPQGQRAEVGQGQQRPAQARQVAPQYSQQDLAKIKDQDHREMFDQVRQLEQRILDISQRFNKELGPETAHVFSVKSVNKAVLRNKVARYRQLLEQWGFD